MHEAGHFFGLLHTFQGFNNRCFAYDENYGDHIISTDPHTFPTDEEMASGIIQSEHFCPIMNPTYTGEDGQSNSTYNFMNYLGDNVRDRFASEQQERIANFVIGSRPSMYNNPSGTTVFLPNGYTVRSGSTYHIASGTTVRLGANNLLTVEAGGTLVLEPGAQVEMESNAQIAAYGRIEALGSPTEPVRFVRANSSQPWKEITLLANDNQFDNVVLDGGEQNLVIASRGNTLSNVRSRNGERNLSTWLDYATSGRSEVYVVNSVFESAEYVGVVMQHVDAIIDGVTITGSGLAGLYITNADVDAGYSLIEGNGSTTFGGSGAEVSTGGYFSLADAGNVIRNNAEHEVWVNFGAGAQLMMDNSIYDATAACSSSERLVYNGSGSTVYADWNYWGSSSPSSTCFYTNIYARWVV